MAETPFYQQKDRQMIRIEFTPAEIEALHYERRYHPDPRVQQRMETLYLKALGLPHQEIGRIVGLMEKSVKAWTNVGWTAESASGTG